ncbi:unnamed protein product [Notodromas monacha]|uniref:SHSP domain-containing protein n=1 Tax=Notodromas monacha TaxID=399045 RepID=A0A7R9GI76_9CRUS|nr:unnamed protein product [Notodromas monacha]CAG0922141.1 unnamed protein product [Notodromas monacha]
MFHEEILDSKTDHELRHILALLRPKVSRRNMSFLCGGISSDKQVDYALGMARFGMVPFFSAWHDNVPRSHTLFDQFFGQNLLDEDLIPRNRFLNTPDYVYLSLVPSARSQVQPSRLDRGLSKVSNDKDEFKVCLDVQQFTPEEISVKTVDNYVVIEGKHEEKEDEHGYIQRHFVRKYQLPEGVKAEAVTSSLSSDGVLAIRAPKPLPVQTNNERVVPITQSPFPALSSGGGDNPEKDAGKNSETKMES